MAPLVFRLGSLTISVNADNVTFDNYVEPTFRAGILLEVNIPLSVIKDSFVYLTSTPSVNLLDSITTSQYACLKRNIGTSQSPTYNHEGIIPHTLNVGFALPAADGYTLTNFISSSSLNKTVEYDLLQYIGLNVLFTNTEINAAIAAADKLLPNGSAITEPLPGIINSSSFRTSILNQIKNGFANKLSSFNVNAAGEGSPYLATQPTNEQGEILDFPPSLEVVRALFNSQPERLTTISTPLTDIQARGVKAGLTAFSLPLEAGDVLDFNIIANTNQKNKSGNTIETRTYRIRATLTA